MKRFFSKRDWLPVLALFQNSFFLYFAIFLYRLPHLSWTRYSLFPCLVIIGILININENWRTCRISDIFYVIAVALILVFNLHLYTDNAEYVLANIGPLVWNVIVCFFIGRKMPDFIARQEEKSKNILLIFTILSITICIAYSFYTLASGTVARLVQDKSDMATAYNVLPCLMWMCWLCIRKSTISSYLVLIICCIYISSLGTRGAMLLLMLFIAICYVLRACAERKILNWLLLIVIAMCVACFYETILRLLHDLLLQLGFSTRILDRFLEGTLLISQSRNQNYDIVNKLITSGPLWGSGLYADRVAIGTYTHNIILEILLNYGILFGSVLIVVIVFFYIRSVVNARFENERMFIIVLILSTTGKLMMSKSYLEDPMFWLTIGYCVSIQGHRRKQVRERGIVA